MQTFLPVPSFRETMSILDYKRLGKQRVEAYQLIKSLTIEGYRWSHHPASKMWNGHLNALIEYMNCAIEEWISRGYNNTMKIFEISGEIIYPKWLGNEQFHSAHRSNLLRKDENYYSKFGWTEPNNLPYIWPIGVNE
jgi:hypothetical protein